MMTHIATTKQAEYSYRQLEQLHALRSAMQTSGGRSLLYTLTEAGEAFRHTLQRAMQDSIDARIATLERMLAADGYEAPLLPARQATPAPATAATPAPAPAAVNSTSDWQKAALRRRAAARKAANARWHKPPARAAAKSAKPASVKRSAGTRKTVAKAQTGTKAQTSTTAKRAAKRGR